MLQFPRPPSPPVQLDLCDLTGEAARKALGECTITQNRPNSVVSRGAQTLNRSGQAPTALNLDLGQWKASEFESGIVRKAKERAYLPLKGGQAKLLRAKSRGELYHSKAISAC